MGLDMYLTRKTYVKNWDHFTPEERTEITVKKGGKKHPTINPNRISYIQEEIGYWRKANHIHNWIVQNLADGVDECQELYFDEQKMEQLLDTCKQVVTILEASEMKPKAVQVGVVQMENGEVKSRMRGGMHTSLDLDDSWQPEFEDVLFYPEEIERQVKQILPPAQGFFFGGTSIDQWYLEDTKKTIEILEACIKEGGYIYYQASW